MINLINKNLNFLSDYPIFKNNIEFVKNIVSILNKDRIVIITAMRWLHKTSIAKEILERTWSKNFFYYNDEIDVENKVKDDNDFFIYFDKYKESKWEFNLIILQNINKIKNFKTVLSKLYKNTTFKIIILSNNVHIDWKVELEIYNDSFNNELNNELLDNKLKYWNLDEINLLNGDYFKITFLDNIKNKIVLKDIINNYSIKSDFLFNQTLTKIALLEESLSIRELHRKIESDWIYISLITLMDYIDFAVNAKIIKRCFSYDIKQDKSINTKVRFYFTDLWIRNIYSWSSTPKKSLIENIIYNNLITKNWEIYNWINGRFDFSFYIKDNNSIIHISLENNKNEIKKELWKVSKVDNKWSKTLILLNQNIPKLKKNEDVVNIVNLSQYK